MVYMRVPREISINEIRLRDDALSSSMYRRVIIPNTNVKPLRDLLFSSQPFDIGEEPGSMHYLRWSTHFFIRTKALQHHSCLLYPKGDAIIPINPKVFNDYALVNGDILISKDSNVGECAMVDGDHWQNHMLSGGIVRLNPAVDRYYFFSFLKHPLFKTQLLAMSPRGSIITHAKTLWLDCFMPFPLQCDEDRVIRYVSALMQTIVEKEIVIKQKSDLIHILIQHELLKNQNKRQFQYQFPTISEIYSCSRLDSSIYDLDYKSKIWIVHNYIKGWETPKAAGFTVTPGPSLEIKILRTRVDSSMWKRGYYFLITPTYISEWGTIISEQFLGTTKKLPELRRGDIVFGESGSHRSLVLLNMLYDSPITTNAHGLYARRNDNNILRSVFFRCFFNWLYKKGVIDLLAVGGSGGHFSPEYFETLPIPKFPEEKQYEIARLYHHDATQPIEKPTLDSFVNWHNRWNTELGIWELDREMKALQLTLSNVQEQIIEGKTVNVPLL